MKESDFVADYVEMMIANQVSWKQKVFPLINISCR